jgi:hypothetical protein
MPDIMSVSNNGAARVIVLKNSGCKLHSHPHYKRRRPMLGSDKAIMGALLIIILGVVVAVLIG